MSIKIIRNSGAVGFIGRERMMIDDRSLPSIANNQQIEVELPQSPAVLTVKSFKSVQQTVHDGDTVLITANRSFLRGILCFFILFLVQRFLFRGTDLGLILSIASFICLLGTVFFIPRYKLEIQNETLSE